MNNREELKNYLQNQIVLVDSRLKGYIADIYGKLLPKRSVYLSLSKYIRDFYEKRTEPRIVIMPGLRGIGKTTLLAQLYLTLPNQVKYKLYFSIDEIVKRFGANLWEVLECYEELIGKHIENLEQPLFLFLDEIHYDPKWPIFLKTVYDRSKNVFVICTGSSALLLREQVNADIARRVLFEEIFPMNFIEYMMIKKNLFPVKGLAQQIKEVLLSSSSAEKIFNSLITLDRKVKDYWLKADRLEVENYLKFGTFPFTTSIKNEALIFDYLGQVINKIIYLDIPRINKFDIETLNKIEKIVYLISDSLSVSITHLGSILDMKKDTLSLVLTTLEKAGFFTKVPPYGAHYKQVRKPSKYLFVSPVLRFYFLNSRNSIRAFEVYKGSLLEDLVAMYLSRILPKFGPISLTYDVSEKGSDFIVEIDRKKIIVEVGVGEKGLEQVKNTLKRIRGDFGIVVGEGDLKLYAEERTVKVPLNYFLLL